MSEIYESLRLFREVQTFWRLYLVDGNNIDTDTIIVKHDNDENVCEDDDGGDDGGGGVCTATEWVYDDDVVDKQSTATTAPDDDKKYQLTAVDDTHFVVVDVVTGQMATDHSSLNDATRTTETAPNFCEICNKGIRFN